MNIGVIFAGGIGSRMGMVGRPKQFVEVAGKPIIVHTLEHFEKCDDVDRVIVVCLLNWIEHMNKLTKDYNLNKVTAIVPGGATGQESIYQGLVAAKQISGNQNAIVLIHDGVRPLINVQLLTDCIRAVEQFGSAITCAKQTETPVRVDGEHRVVEAFPREETRHAKAPQCFYLNDILEAHEDAKRKGKTDYIDSCSLMLQYRPALHFIECSKANIKITDFEDIYLLQALLRAREDIVNFSWGGV